MKYLVTGGCGFIGSNYILQLLAETTDVEVVNVDCLTYAGRRENLVSVEQDPRYKFYLADIRHPDIIDRIFQIERPDVVVAFAAESHVDRSIESANAFIHTNIVGTFYLLEAARRYGIGTFIQIGTDEVYGQVPSPQSSVETDPLDPRSPYSSSKASSDLLALSYYTTHRVPVIVTRCCNNYGPRQFPEKLIPLFVTNLMDGKQVPVYGDGRQVREWIHVDDHNKAIDFVITHGQAGQIYNIGSGVGLENITITYRLIEGLGKDLDCIKHVEDRKGHDRRYSINCSKLQKLGLKPRQNFEEVLASTIKWYEDNQDWWRPLKND